MPKRRANHEGTIYKRQDGCWVASVTMPGGKRKSFYGRTRQEVAQKLTVGLKARLDGIPLPSDQLKVGRYLQEWWQSVAPSIRPTTWRRYEHCYGSMYYQHGRAAADALRAASYPTPLC